METSVLVSIHKIFYKSILCKTHKIGKMYLYKRVLCSVAEGGGYTTVPFASPHMSQPKRHQFKQRINALTTPMKVGQRRACVVTWKDWSFFSSTTSSL